MATQFDRVVQYMDTDGYPAVVDPIGNSAWIHEGQDGKHLATVERGRQIDHKAFEHTKSLLLTQKADVRKVYVPSFGDIEALPKFPSHVGKDMCGCDTFRGQLRDMRGVGKLPVISAQLRRGALPDKPDGDIERQMYQSREIVFQRLMLRDGTPDHGLPTDGNCE